MKRYINLFFAIFASLVVFLILPSDSHAAPTIQSVTESNFGSNGTTHNVQMPATVNAGDMLLVLISMDGSGTITTPSGWQALHTASYSNVMRLASFFRIADGTEDGTTVNFATSGSETMSAQVYRISGASAIRGAGVTGGTSGSINPNSLSMPYSAETLWIAYGARNDASHTLTSPPTNYTDGVRTTSGSGTSGAQVVSARRVSTSSSEDPGSFTMSSTSSNWLTETIGIRGFGTNVQGRQVFDTGENGTGELTLMRPPDVTSGVLMVAFMQQSGGSGISVTPPSGWTGVSANQICNSSDCVNMYYKTATGSEPGTYFWDTNGTADTSGWITSYTGVSGVNVWSSAFPTASPHPWPSVTTTAADTIVVLGAGNACGGVWHSSAPPAGYNLISNTSPGSGFDFAAGYDKVQASAGATGSPSLDFQNTGCGAGLMTVAFGAIVKTTGYSGLSYNYFQPSGTYFTPTANTFWYGSRWGAGAGYSGYACQDLPVGADYSTVSGNSSGSIVTHVSSGITAGTLYYFCLYLRDATTGIYYYSPTTSSVTTSAPQVPTMERLLKSEITSTTADIYGQPASENGASITAKGICYSSTNTTPAVSQGGTTCTDNGTGTGSFTANLTSLTANTLYYFRSYATNSAGTGYSSYVDTFTTEGGSPNNYPQVASTTGLYDRSNTTTHNVPMPATVNAGDLLVVLTTNDGLATVTTPSGWTQLFTTANGSLLRTGAYYKSAAGTEDGTTVNFATSASEILTATVYRITGADGIEAGTAATGTSTAPNPPSLTPSWGAKNTLWIALAGVDNPHAAYGKPTAYPANYVNDRWEGDTYSQSGTYAGVDSARRYLNATSDDPGTFTLPQSMGWVANTIAIEPLITTPLVTSNPTSSITQTTATLNGNANPNGLASTGWFRYYTSDPGTCSDSGGTRAPSSSGSSLGSGSTGVNYNQGVTGLTPGTAYYVCAFASNSQGTGVGTPVGFSTAAGTPTSVTATGEDDPPGSYYVTINGSANPNNFASHGFFRLYTSDPGSCTDSGGTRYPSAQGSDTSLGSGAAGQTFSYDVVSGLTPDTTYFYCAFARNAYGTVGSSVDSFTTPDGPISACDPPSGGNHTITTSCSYSGSIGGVDSGTGTNNTATLSVSSNRSLTLNPGQQVAWGSLGISGSINLGSGSSLRRAPIWITDADGDGTIGGTSQTIGSQPGGGVRRNAVSSTYSYYSKIVNAAETDCNDNSAFVYRTVNSLVTDTDNDGYKTSAGASNPCVGDTSTINERTYYEDSSGSYSWLPSTSALESGATDCQDNPNGAPCAPASVTASNPSSQTQNNVSWSGYQTGGEVPTPDSFDVQWCTGTSCTPPASGTLTNVNTPYAHTGRSAGTTYGYRIVAKKGGQSSSATTPTQYATTAAACSNQTVYSDNDGDGIGNSGVISAGLVNTASTDNGSNIVINKPADIINGSFMLVSVEWDGGTQRTLTPPAGWTQVAYVNNSTDVGIGMWYRYASSEGSTYTWTANGTTDIRAWITSFGNVATSNPIGNTTTNTGGASPNHVGSSLTPTAANYMLVMSVGNDNGDQSYTPPSGMTEFADKPVQGSDSMAGFYEWRTTSSATGSKTAVYTNNNNFGFASIMAEIKRLAPSTTTQCVPPVTGAWSTTNTDCDDTLSAYYQNVNGYPDKDGDGVNPSSQSTMCSGSSLRPGVSSSPGTDCNSNDGGKWQNLTAYTDTDNDSYTVGSSQQICSGIFVPQGYRSSASGTADCYDSNSNARPNQTSYFTSDRGDGSFDYNCNSATDKQYPGTRTCTSGTSSVPYAIEIEPGVYDCPTVYYCTSVSGTEAACGDLTADSTQQSFCYYWVCGGNNNCTNGYSTNNLYQGCR